MICLLDGSLSQVTGLLNMQLGTLLCVGTTVWPHINALLNRCETTRLSSHAPHALSFFLPFLHILDPFIPLPGSSASLQSTFLFLLFLTSLPSLTPKHTKAQPHTHTLCAGGLHRLISPRSDTFGAAACGLLIMSTADDSHHAFPFLPNNAAPSH